MPIVSTESKILYTGSSKEDADLVYEMAREFGCYQRLYYHQDCGEPSPGGVCGKILGSLENSNKSAAIREVLKNLSVSPVRWPQENKKWNDQPSPEPPKQVVKNLITASSSKNFEAARREWEYDGHMIYEGEAGFTRECALCGPKELMKTNFVIRNVINGNKLLVGSTCVKRFLILTGTKSESESADSFDRITALSVFGRNLRGYLADLGADTIPEKSLVGIMGALEKAFPKGISQKEAGIVLVAAGVRGKAAEIFMALVTKNAKALRGLKIDKISDKEEKRKKLRPVFTTLSMSSAYRNPASL